VTVPKTEFNCLALSQPGPTKKRNEDALLLNGQVHQGNIHLEQKVSSNKGESLVFAVADGMAGSPYAHMGSSLLLQLLQESFRKSPAPENLRNRLLELQDHFVARGRRMKCPGTAATLAGVVISGGQVQIFNVGDSRVYRIKDGEIRQLSRDHTELADMIENGEIEPMSIREAPSSFLEPSSFYMADPMHMLTRVYLRSIKLQDAGTILICSDGLVDVLEDDEIAVAAQAGTDTLLVQVSTARKRNGLDDITLIQIGLTYAYSSMQSGKVLRG
jgi:serine/threonine protein phosphatase PrpC